MKRSVNREPSVNRWSRIALGLTLAAVLTGALGLAACGRKGPLDPPPSASLPPPPPAVDTRSATVGVPPPGTTAAVTPPPPATPPPPPKTFFLDFLLAK